MSQPRTTTESSTYYIVRVGGERHEVHSKKVRTASVLEDQHFEALTLSCGGTTVVIQSTVFLGGARFFECYSEPVLTITVPDPDTREGMAVAQALELAAVMVIVQRTIGFMADHALLEEYEQ